MLAVVTITGYLFGMMCQGLLWIEFVMASTRVASVSFRLKRVRRFVSISMISYVALATLLLVLALGGSWSATTLFRAINGSIVTFVTIIFLYASHKMAAQHSQRESLLSPAPLTVLPSLRGVLGLVSLASVRDYLTQFQLLTITLSHRRKYSRA